jgi:hypothetical protein
MERLSKYTSACLRLEQIHERLFALGVYTRAPKRIHERLERIRRGLGLLERYVGATCVAKGFLCRMPRRAALGATRVTANRTFALQQS